jgi:hypothetical protein
VYMEYLCRPSEASTRFCVIPGGYPPQDWQSLPCAGEELELVLANFYENIKPQKFSPIP